MANAEPATGTCTKPDGTNAADLVYQTGCSFTCKTGYNRVGAEKITCQLNKQWSPAKPTCNGKEQTVVLTQSRLGFFSCYRAGRIGSPPP